MEEGELVEARSVGEAVSQLGGDDKADRHPG